MNHLKRLGLGLLVCAIIGAMIGLAYLLHKHPVMVGIPVVLFTIYSIGTFIDNLTNLSK